jgi:hypothetical protein
VVAFCLGCSATRWVPPPASTAFSVRTYTLPSGLRVVVEQDVAARLVGMVWVVDAGEAATRVTRIPRAQLPRGLAYGLAGALVLLGKALLRSASSTSAKCLGIPRGTRS